LLKNQVEALLQQLNWRPHDTVYHYNGDIREAQEAVEIALDFELGFEYLENTYHLKDD
jgi:hypothetical protein